MYIYSYSSVFNTELHINIIQPIVMNIEYIYAGEYIYIYMLFINKTQAQNVHQLGGGGLMFNLRFNIL